MSREQEQSEIIDLLRDYWLALPELRLGQLWENIFGCGCRVIDGRTTCIFYLFDESMRDKIRDRIEVSKKL